MLIMDNRVMKEDKPTNAVNKPLENSAEVRDSLLSSMSRNARLSKGAMNYSDTMEQGAQINNELVILRQFNLVAFLTIMREFQEINRLYNNDDERFSHRFRMLLEMEREREAKQQQTQFLYAEEERHRLSKNQEQINQKTHDQDAKHKQLMQDLDMLRQLQQELQHLREAHYARQNVLYDELTTLREEQMDEMLKIARESKDISPKQLARLEQIHEDHHRRKEQIDRMPTMDANGKHDWEMAKRKMEAHKELHQHTSGRLKAWLHDNSHAKDVKQGYDKHQTNIEKEEKIIAENDRKFKTHEAKLHEQIAAKENATKGVQKISDCIDLIEKMDKSKLSSQEKDMIKSIVNQLESHQRDLSSSQSRKEQQCILKSCISDLKKIEDIIKPSAANSELYKVFKNSINDLEMQLTPVKTQANMSAHSVNAISTQNINNHQDVSSPHGFTQFKSTYKELRSENSVNNEQLNQLKKIINEEFQIAVSDAGIEDEDEEIIQELKDKLSKVCSCDALSKINSELLQEIINPIDNLIEKYSALEDTLLKISNLCTKIERDYQPPISDENTNTNQYRI